MGGGPGTLTVATSLAGDNSLVINGNVVLSNTDNSYSGGTVVQSGILNIENGSALGTMAAGVYVDYGATLQLQGGIAVAGRGRCTSQGSGSRTAMAASSARWTTCSDDNYWSGPIELDTTAGGSTRIDSDAGTLALTGGISAEYANSPLVFGGSGPSGVVSVANLGIVGPNVDGLTKDGPGMLTLAAADSYAGGTTIEDGEFEGLGDAIPGGSLTIDAGRHLIFSPVGGATEPLVYQRRLWRDTRPRGQTSLPSRDR